MASGWICKNARKALYVRDNSICCYCGKTCVQGDTRKMTNAQDAATLDHIVPQVQLAASSTNDAHFAQLRRDPKNLVVVCMGCNSSKKHTELYVWCKQTNKNYPRILAEIARRIILE